MQGVDSRYYTLFLISIAVCVVIGLVLAFTLKQETEDDDKPTTEKDLLKDIERAYFAGTMDREEFERAKALIPTKLTAPPPRPKTESPPPAEPVSANEPDPAS